ncbi:hypothetical protein MTR_3g031300 [Medicago truncatula]|uniref:Uncharacterized protein n=1 Tax=Medicago truncatula TaxID=3880 RepID=G7J0M7_MEDTR|nr:hypothetical protein MTR_3g031300 [Medicago truncatula]
MEKSIGGSVKLRRDSAIDKCVYVVFGAIHPEFHRFFLLATSIVQVVVATKLSFFSQFLLSSPPRKNTTNFLDENYT